MATVKTAIKGKLVDFEKKIFGLFIAFIEESTERIFHVNAICGKSSFISTYDISTLYVNQTLDLMETLLIRGEANTIDSTKLQDTLKKNEDLFVQLAQNSNMQHNIENTIVARLDILFDSNFTIVTRTISTEDEIIYENIIEKSLNKIEEQQNEILRKDLNIPFGIEILQCNAILSPVTGIPVRNLKKGDVVNIYPSDDWSKSRKIAIANGFFDEDLEEMKKVPGTITKIKIENKEVSFLLKLSDSVVGVTTVSEGVKIEAPEEDQKKALLYAPSIGDTDQDPGSSEFKQKKEFDIIEFLRSTFIETPLGYYLSLAGAIIVLLYIIYNLL